MCGYRELQTREGGGGAQNMVAKPELAIVEEMVTE